MARSSNWFSMAAISFVLSILSLVLAPLVADSAPAKEPLNGIESSLTLYVYPPTVTLDWTTPRSVLSSFLRSEIDRQFAMDDAVQYESSIGEKGKMSSVYRSTMGHTIAHIQCVLPDSTVYDRWSSFSGQNYIELDKKNLLKDQLGMGVLFYDYPDGHIIEGEENLKRITFYRGSKQLTASGKIEQRRPRYLQVEIDREACSRLKEMVGFFEEFHFSQDTKLAELMKRPADKVLYFNSTLDPYETYLRRKQDPSAKIGGGCAPYGVALLKMAGHFDPSFEEPWTTSVEISEKLIGGRGNRVNVFDLLLGFGGFSWDRPGTQARLFHSYDPEKIWVYLDEVQACLDRGGARCSAPVAQNWIERQQGSILSGTEVIFRDSVVKRVYTTHPRLGPQSKLTTVNVSQPVNGIVWRNKAAQ